ncbi:MAG TPA: molybdopterin-dependent oxidoreductase [Candidatus Baltobacteraceae bacterium]
MKRRLFVAGSLTALAGCSPIGTALNNTPGFEKFLGSAGNLDHALIGTRGMAREYKESDIDPVFRVNGLATPTTAMYRHIVADKYASYRLIVDGAVERRGAFTLGHLQHLMQRTQITRHDCVEGWSVIGKWTGVPLGDLLDIVKPKPEARYVVFYCMDSDDQGTPYYESLDLHEARHPQTLLALQLNGKPIDPDHGAPVRLRIPTQLGYKSAKWVRRIEVVASMGTIYGGGGGYWEDQGYDWYAGI